MSESNVPDEYRGELHDYLGDVYPDVDFLIPGHDELWPMLETAHESLVEMRVQRQEREIFTLGFGLGALTAGIFLAFISSQSDR